MERTPANTDPVRSEQQRQDWTSTIFVNPLFNLKTGPAPPFFSTFLLRLDQHFFSYSRTVQGWTSTILLLNPISSTVGLDQCTSSQTSSSITWLDPVLISILFSHPCSPSPLVSPENLSLVSHHHHCHCQCHWLVDAAQTTVKHFVKFLPPSAIEDLTQR